MTNILAHDLGQVEYEEAGPKGRQTLVLFHTLLAEMSVYDRIFPELAKSRHVLRFNFPGYGKSTGQCKSIDDYADWTAAVFKAFKFNHPAHIFSNGFGGFVSLAFCLRHPSLVASLTVANSGPGFPEERKVPLRALSQNSIKLGMSAVLDVAINRMFPSSFAQAHPEIIERRKQALSGADPAQFSQACLALTELDLSSRLADIRCPVKVIAGMDDQTTPPEMSRALVTGIPNVRYNEIPLCGHCPQLQRPEELIRLIQD